MAMHRKVYAVVYLVFAFGKALSVPEQGRYAGFGIARHGGPAPGGR